MYPTYGYPWGGMPPQIPIAFIPPATPQSNPQFTSWKDVQVYAKKEAKREAKLKAKWEAEAKGKKEAEQKKTQVIKRPSVPLIEGLFFMVLLSPFIGLPTLKLYQFIFELWGSALGTK
jgi:hypothetical protein